MTQQQPNPYAPVVCPVCGTATNRLITIRWNHTGHGRCWKCNHEWEIPNPPK
ncbi:MAG: hypothetical protein QMD46_12710 [Methanomicrobiales archaeon]|nr:hypothetical protein [Methanomicrobiales archaeon]